MHEFDKIIMMQAIEEILKYYRIARPYMAAIIENKHMTPAHTGMVELAAQHLARACAELEKLDKDWRIVHGKESDK